MSSYHGQSGYSPSYDESNAQWAGYQLYQTPLQSAFIPSFYTDAQGRHYIQHAPNEYALVQDYEKALKKDHSWAQRAQLQMQSQPSPPIYHPPSPAQPNCLRTLNSDFMKAQEKLKEQLLDLSSQVSELREHQEMEAQNYEQGSIPYQEEDTLFVEQQIGHSQEEINRRANIETAKLKSRIAEQEAFRPKIPSWRSHLSKPSMSSPEPSQFHIPSFKPKNSFQEPVLEFQTTTLPEQPTERGCLSQEAPLVSQEDEVWWMPQWNLPPGVEMPFIFKDTTLVSEQGPVAIELSCDKEDEYGVSVQSDDSDEEGQKVMEEVMGVQPVLLAYLFDELPLFVDDEKETIPSPMGEDQSEQEVRYQQEVDTQKEESMFWFDELPDLVEQEEGDMAVTTSEEGLQLQEDVDHHDDLLFCEVTVIEETVQNEEINENLEEVYFSNIIKGFCDRLGEESLFPVVEIYKQHGGLIQGPNFCSLEEATLNFECLPSSIIEEEYSSLNSSEDFKIGPDVAIFSQVDSLDSLLEVLAEDDNPLTEKEELDWQAIVQENQYEQQHGASQGNSNFPRSRGCPIRYLAKKEVNNERVAVQAAEHNSPLKGEAEDAFAAESEHFQLIHLVLRNRAFDQLNEVSVLITYIFQDMVNQILDHLPMFHVFFVAVEHVIYPKLRRKGRYFSEPVNGFV